MVRRLRRDEEGLSTLSSLVGVLILVVAILAVYFGYIVPKFPPPPPRALPGDTVVVDYIGTFENGLVFDTSLGSVASDNASHPKAFAFGWHAPWQPLTFEMGKQPPAVIAGFERGIQGLAAGDTTTIPVPPELGYGPADPAKIQVKPLLESVPVRLTMNTSDFRKTYGTEAVGGTSVRDPVWGWTSTVEVSGSLVTVTNSPEPGDSLRPYTAWDAKVLSIDSGADGGVGRIQVQHLLTAASVDRVGRRSSGGTVSFVVTAVDVVAGTFTLDYNEPTKGRVLVFQVTVVRIVSLA